MPDFCKFGSMENRTILTNVSPCIYPATYKNLCLIVPWIYWQVMWNAEQRVATDIAGLVCNKFVVRKISKGPNSHFVNCAVGLLKRFYMQYSSILFKCISIGFNFDIKRTCAPENISFNMCFCCKPSGRSLSNYLVIKILLLSPSMPFILYRTCSIHLN